MKRYIKASTLSNSNAVAIATEVFGQWYRENPNVKIFKQSRGYVLKYYSDSSSVADNVLQSMCNAAIELNIPIISSGKKPGYLGSNAYAVAYVVVPVT